METPPSPPDEQFRREPGRDGEGADGHSNTAVLIERARNGDDRAWRELYHRHAAFLKMLVRTRLREDVRRRFDVDDVLQSAYLAAFDNLAGFEYRGTGSFQRWMVRLVGRHLTDFSRRETRESRTPRSEVASGDGQHDLASGEPGPHTVLLQSEEEERVIAELAALDPVDREIVVMRVWDQATWAAIAAAVRLPEATARNRYVKIVQGLVRRLSS